MIKYLKEIKFWNEISHSIKILKYVIHENNVENQGIFEMPALLQFSLIKPYRNQELLNTITVLGTSELNSVFGRGLSMVKYISTLISSTIAFIFRQEYGEI